MDTIQIKLDKHVAEAASAYAQKKGETLSALIEGYLKRLTRHEKSEEQQVPDIVLSLLGAGTPVDEDDLNAREAFYTHLEEKHR
jgi:hypothetical protein